MSKTMDMTGLLRDAEEGHWDFAPVAQHAELRVLIRRIVRDEMKSNSHDGREIPLPSSPKQTLLGE